MVLLHCPVERQQWGQNDWGKDQMPGTTATHVGQTLISLKEDRKATFSHRWQPKVRHRYNVALQNYVLHAVF